MFEENLGNFLGEMRAELSVSLYRYDEAIREGNLQGLCDDYIDKRISDIRTEMVTEAAVLVAETVAEIENRERWAPGTA